MMMDELNWGDEFPPARDTRTLSTIATIGIFAIWHYKGGFKTQTGLAAIRRIPEFSRMITVDVHHVDLTGLDSEQVLYCVGTPTFAMLQYFAQLKWPGHKNLQLIGHAKGPGVCARKMLDRDNTEHFFSKWAGKMLSITVRCHKLQIAQIGFHDALAYGNVINWIIGDDDNPAYQLLSTEAFIALIEKRCVGPKDNVKSAIDKWSLKKKYFHRTWGTIFHFLRTAVAVVNAVLAEPLKQIGAVHTDVKCEGSHVEGVIDFVVEIHR
jgi:hypothetical protein